MQITNLAIAANQHELTKHGSATFPLAIYENVLSRNVLGFINWHWHDDLQFCCVTKGPVAFYVQEKKYLLEKGMGIFINSGYLHMAKPLGGPDSTYLCLDFNPRLLASFAGSIFEHKYVEPYIQNPALAEVLLEPDKPWQKVILSCLPKINSLGNTRTFGWEYKVLALINNMWLTLLQNYDYTDKQIFRKHLKKNAIIQNILSYIKQHYGEPLKLDTLAQSVNFSGSVCCRLFKQVTGETIFTYLQTYRLAQSVELLLSSELSISQIAYETGFASTSYFIASFKEKFGLTPLQYRKNTRHTP